MAARKKANRPSRKANARRTGRPVRPDKSEEDDACLYLGCFFFDSFGVSDQVGTFQIVIEAMSPDDVMKRLRRRLKTIRASGSILTGTYTIYLEGLVPLTGSFKEGLMVNYESRPSDEPPDCQLLNFMPEQGRPTPRSYRIGKDGTTEKAFMDFGGKAHLRVLEAAKKLASEGAATSVPHRPMLSAEDRERVRAEAAAQKARRAAEVQATKQARLAAAEAKQRRDRVLKQTLAELGTPPR
jgi:hypothetical protein